MVAQVGCFLDVVCILGFYKHDGGRGHSHREGLANTLTLPIPELLPMRENSMVNYLLVRAKVLLKKNAPDPIVPSF